MGYTIICRTAVDRYKDSTTFVPLVHHVPRIGETVEVRDYWREWYSQRNLPTRMEVVDVIYTTENKKPVVIIELHYKAIDIQIAEQNKVKLF